jgi:hypothetical protein
MTDLEQIIHNSRLFCASEKSEDQAIRDFAYEEGIVLTRGEVRKAKRNVTEIIASGSAINQKFFG